MSYSINTGQILKYMGYTPVDDYMSTTVDGGATLAWYHADPKPTEQDVLDNELGWSQEEAKSRVKLEGAKRIALVYPFIDSTSESALALYDMVRDIYFLIVPAAREPLTGSILELKNTFDAATNAIADISLMTDVTLVQNYDAVNTPNWP